jgi:hypothetical protein
LGCDQVPLCDCCWFAAIVWSIGLYSLLTTT